MIADRSPLYREGLKIALAGERSWQLTEVESVAGLVAYKEQISQRDLVIIDASFFRVEDNHLVSNFISITPAPVLLLCNQNALSSIEYAKKKGAQGMVSKASSLGCIARAVETILAGGSFWPDSAKPLLPRNTIVDETEQKIEEHINSLTPRERGIVPYLMQGKLYKQIAYELGLQDATIKFHAANIQRKMHSRNRTHLVSMLTKVIPSDSVPVGELAN
ncbi:MAG: response regulator transcription factor [Amphritea sp.]